MFFSCFYLSFNISNNISWSKYLLVNADFVLLALKKQDPGRFYLKLNNTCLHNSSRSINNRKILLKYISLLHGHTTPVRFLFRVRS